jgi:hypothetical protein
VETTVATAAFAAEDSPSTNIARTVKRRINRNPPKLNTTPISAAWLPSDRN